MTWLACLVLAPAAMPLIAAAQQAEPGEAAPEQVESAGLETPQATGAQATFTDATRAREAVVRAVGEYNAGRYEEAYALFSRAHRLEPTARTLRGMGMVLFELRRYVDATQRLSEALHSEQRPLSESQRAQTEALLARARQFIARVIVHVSPSDAILTLDGVPVELTDGELDLDTGEYTLVGQCEGCRSQTVRVRALAGQRQEISMVLPSLTPRLSHPDVPTLPQRPNLTPPALTLGAGLALLLAAVPTALIARDAEAKLASACLRGVCDAELRPTRDRADRFALVTDVLWITGAAVTAAGLTWLLARRTKRSAFDLQVACGPQGCASRVSGRF